MGKTAARRDKSIVLAFAFARIELAQVFRIVITGEILVPEVRNLADLGRKT